MTKPTEQEIQDTLVKVATIVAETANVSDIEYFNFHKQRYLRMVRSVASYADKGAAILNIGSHYLHTSLIFKFLGYDVHSMDVEVFWELDLVKARARNYGLEKIIENDLGNLLRNDEVSEMYEVILFAEIMEHITFNPVCFWKKIYTITKTGGIIYISTPNSLNLYNIARTFARIITLRGVGLPIGSIFANVTYGHHWKEYSAREIRKYFQMLSDDFKVSTSFYHYREPEFDGFPSAVYSTLSMIGNALYFTSDEIEAIVTVEKRGSWKMESPGYL